MTEASPASERTWTIRDILAWSRDYFASREVDSPRLTAEVLLSHVLSVARVKLYADFDRPLEKRELAAYKQLVLRRVAGEPTQYLVGSTEFYGRRFLVDARALIPRPETELVVERILRELPRDAPATVADVGCGSGVIGLTIAAERPQARVVLTDVSPEAASLARENAERFRLGDRVDVREGDLAEPLGTESFDAVVANLPYVPAKARLARHIVEHEPHLALFAGDDGLDAIRRLVPALDRHVRPGGLVVLEHGEEQGAAIRELFAPGPWEAAVTEADLAGLDRFTWAVRRG